MSHYTPMHARDGQRRDAWRARARDTWTRLRRLAARIAALPGALIPGRATMIPAPDMRPAQEKPRPGDHQRRASAARSGPGQPLVVAGEQPGELPHLPGCDGSCGGMAAHEAHLDDGGCPCCYCARYAVNAPQTPGAVNADDGTGTSAGGPRPPAADATPPNDGGVAPLPPPEPGPPQAGRGQHLPNVMPPQAEGTCGQAFPATRGHHPTWVITQPPPGSPLGYQPVPRYRGDYRPTQPFRAVGDLPPVNIFRPHYERHEARRDSTARWGA